MDYSEIEKNIGYHFKDKTLLKLALTHSSSVTNDHTKCNQRLEFLGDAVLQLAISTLLYDKLPTTTEGVLSKKRALIVCADSLYESADAIHIKDYLILGKGEDENGGRQKKNIIADATESLIGAIYLDGGMEKATAFINCILYDIIEHAIIGDLTYDYKTLIQEYAQQNELGEISYSLMKTQGPEHDMYFWSQINVAKHTYNGEKGHNRKESEQKAAKVAFEELKKIYG